MCGRYVRKSDKQQIAETMKIASVFTDPLPPNYNVAPSTFQPIVRLNRDTEERELVLARWGLVPFFAKSLEAFKGFSTINAKAEDVDKKPTWRSPFQRRRCLVPVDSFYEWKKLDDSPKPKKQPYAFGLKGGKPFAFAGLWDAWHDPARQKDDPNAWLQSFTILTTEANEIMAPVHTRMPVILHERDWARWLERDGEARPPLDLLRPYEAELMEAHPANPAVGNVRNNGPEMLEYPDQGATELLNSN